MRHPVFKDENRTSVRPEEAVVAAEVVAAVVEAVAEAAVGAVQVQEHPVELRQVQKQQEQILRHQPQQQDFLELSIMGMPLFRHRKVKQQVFLKRL